MQTLASPGAARKVEIMMNSRQGFRRILGGVSGMVVLALLAVPSFAAAQSGDGFLFREPRASFTFRGGYELANTSGEPFSVLKRETTLGPRSFDAFSGGVDLNVFLPRRFDLVVSLDLTSRTRTAEYREWEENGQPIRHQSSLDRAAFGAGLRYNLVDRGRRISSLAFIPARTVPYVGVNAGIISYDFTQKGDFVEASDDNTASIFTDELSSNGHSFMTQAFAGIDRRLNARWSLVGEARYTHADAELVADYSGLGNIQLSGLALNVGVAVRF
jgi:hypothetical protein